MLPVSLQVCEWDLDTLLSLLKKRELKQLETASWGISCCYQPTNLVPWSAKYLFRPSPASLGSGFGSLTQPDPAFHPSPLLVGHLDTGQWVSRWVQCRQDAGRRFFLTRIKPQLASDSRQGPPWCFLERLFAGFANCQSCHNHIGYWAPSKQIDWPPHQYPKLKPTNLK